MISIKIASIEDATLISSIQKSSFRELYHKYGAGITPYTETLEKIQQKIASPEAKHFLIYFEEEVVGFARVRLKAETEAWQGTLAVLPDFQGRGIASRALQLIEQEFPLVKKWSLDTILEESHLVRFYEKMGYIQTSHLLDKGIDLVIMEKHVK